MKNAMINGIRAFLLIVFMLNFFSSFGYDGSKLQEIRKYDYSKVDSFVVNLPDRHYEDVAELTDVLTKPFSSEQEKFRSIFRWVTDNVSYDCDAYHYTEKFNKNIRFYSFLKKAVSDSFVENIYNKNVKVQPADVLKRRTAICSGYAALLDEMCENAGIGCERVRGYVKTSSDEISTGMNVICHAWNVVKLNGQWYPVDVTWASGYTDGTCTKYYKDYSDSYFIQDPEQFIKNHFPRQKEWQLVSKPVSLKEFCQMPAVLDGYFKNELECSTQSGLVNVELNKPVRLKFRSGKELNSSNVELYINSRDYNDSFKLMKEDDNFYVVEFKAPKKGESVATIVVNSCASIQYKVIAK